jgi:hypothetical protein
LQALSLLGGRRSQRGLAAEASLKPALAPTFSAIYEIANPYSFLFSFIEECVGIKLSKKM